ITEVSKSVSDQEDPILLLGDLNITPWSPIFKDFLRSTGLRDSREGFGLQPSWPTWFPPAWIPIDHVLVSSNVTVYDRKIERDIGSDHYPVIVDFSVTASH
ncbi:MAG: endonuclease/exonuclease/phosphatase family protein, partial [Nitrososphaerales archaeon]